MKKNKSFIIGISGSSGVGKTSMSNIINLIFDKKEVLVLSGDDLHKWERNDENWNIYTHLNPLANNLEKGYYDLLNLKNGKSIQRSSYNHNTGKFDDSKLINTHPVIIYEGLHSLYDKETLKILDLKIYVDTDDDLTYEWKIKRDVLNRGYSKEDVEKVLERRKKDNKEFILPQKDNADVILKFKKNQKNKIELVYEIINKNIDKDIVRKIEEKYKIISDFLELSTKLSFDINLIQASGGNISIKTNKNIIVKSSGSHLSQVNFFKGFSICKMDKQIPHFDCEDSYNNFLRNLLVNGDENPSMETGFHLTLKDKVVIHTHPIYLNVILCSKESKKIIKELFNDLDYELIDYVTPGYKLTNKLTNTNKSIYFLENHGLIVSGKNISKTLKLLEKINRKCKEWVSKNVENYVDIQKKNVSLHLFPDSVVFEKEMNIFNSLIYNLILKCSLTPKFLTNDEVNEIINLESEKLRKKKI